MKIRVKKSKDFQGSYILYNLWTGDNSMQGYYESRKAKMLCMYN